MQKFTKNSKKKLFVLTGYGPYQEHIINNKQARKKLQFQFSRFETYGPMFESATV